MQKIDHAVRQGDFTHEVLENRSHPIARRVCFSDVEEASLARQGREKAAVEESGTQCLIAAFDVATGKVIGAIGPRRAEADYVRFLEALLTSAPEDTRWEVVADNLNTHRSEGVARLVAKLCGIDADGRSNRTGW